MFAGHLGVALAAARVEPRLHVGLLAAASLLLDLLLWIFVLLDVESVVIPADFATTHQPVFDFPFSHGLVAAAAWSVGGGVGVVALSRIRRGAGAGAALVVASAVFSHWILDALVHRPELPVLGAASRRVGAGLWNEMPVALALEAALVAGGLLFFLSGSALSAGKKAALATVVLGTLGLTIAGMTVAPPPPSATAMAASSLAAIALVCGLVGWLGRGARRG